MTEQLGLELVDLPEPLVPLEPGEKLSADRRRTLRQRQDVELGRHPLTGGTARPDLGTCGGCVHRRLVGGHAQSYPKCDYGVPAGKEHLANSWPRASMGAGTDVRAWWPACSDYQPRHPGSPT